MSKPENTSRKQKKIFSGEKKISYILSALLFLLLITGFGVMVNEVWKNYRDTLIENQKEQLLLVSQTLGKNLGVALTEYEDNLAFLCRVEEAGTGSDVFYKKYTETQNNFVKDLFWEDEKGYIIRDLYGIELENPVLVTRISDERSIWNYDDADGKKYLVFKEYLEQGGKLCLVIDEEEYYKELISDIHLGTNGYVMIKNSEGRILMHPEKAQWGIFVIEGRRKMFPDLDYSSLEEMVKEQTSGKSGLSEYYSYWWTDPKLPRVKKVSAYAPAQIGDDFWVISAVIDYNDLYVPVREGFRQIAFLFGGMLAVVLVLALIFGRLLIDRRKAALEISDLRELNTLLEEVHRSEEDIAHQQRLQIMGTMTGGIAHEFNNFLTPIMGHAELLMMELPEESDEFDSAQEIYEAADKAKDVIRQISSLSRKNVETVYKNVPAGKMLTRAFRMVESVCPSNVHLEKEIRIGEECILGNATQINQVILNICVNAIHAIGKSEGKIMVRAMVEDCDQIRQIPGRKTAEISDVWKKYISIEIEDDGCGMEADTLRQIFDPFFTTKKGGEGTGLGLALAEQIILSHKGQIFAESEVGKGTIFHILLPVMEDMAEPKRYVESRKDSLRIVIADDNAKILRILEKNFAKLNLPVVTCMRKSEILDKLEEDKTDVLVIDESVEDGSGVEFCMAIKGKYPDILRILMTDGISREIVEAKQHNIIDAYIEKPVSDTTIIEAIRNCSAEHERKGIE
ncbi:MAG: ATP-binding protein [Bariatricus sp.]